MVCLLMESMPDTLEAPPENPDEGPLPLLLPLLACGLFSLILAAF